MSKANLDMVFKLPAQSINRFLLLLTWYFGVKCLSNLFEDPECFLITFRSRSHEVQNRL